MLQILYVLCTVYHTAYFSSLHAGFSRRPKPITSLLPWTCIFILAKASHHMAILYTCSWCPWTKGLWNTPASRSTCLYCQIQAGNKYNTLIMIILIKLWRFELILISKVSNMHLWLSGFQVCNERLRYQSISAKVFQSSEPIICLGFGFQTILDFKY